MWKNKDLLQRGPWVEPFRQCNSRNIFLSYLKDTADTGKSFSEALILASTNPQYDKRLFMELP